MNCKSRHGVAPDGCAARVDQQIIYKPIICLGGLITQIIDKFTVDVCRHIDSFLWGGFSLLELWYFARCFRCVKCLTLNGSNGEFTNGDDFDHADRVRANREARNHRHRRNPNIGRNRQGLGPVENRDNNNINPVNEERVNREDGVDLVAMQQQVVAQVPEAVQVYDAEPAPLPGTGNMQLYKLFSRVELTPLSIMSIEGIEFIVNRGVENYRAIFEAVNIQPPELPDQIIEVGWNFFRNTTRFVRQVLTNYGQPAPYMDPGLDVHGQYSIRREPAPFELPFIGNEHLMLHVRDTPRTLHNVFREVELSTEFIDFMDARIHVSSNNIDNLHDFISMFLNDVKMPQQIKDWWLNLPSLTREDYKQALYQRVSVRLMRMRNYRHVGFNEFTFV